MNFNKKSVRQKTLKMAITLAGKIGQHKVIDDPDILTGYSKDESVCEAQVPDLCVRAYCADDVVELMKLADEYEVPVTPRGAGTGKAGGAIPIAGGVVLDMMRMNSVKSIDTGEYTALVEPGMVTGHFQSEVKAQGLFYPPDPGSLDTCSLGGNAAHNAGGPSAFKYGVTRRYILGTQVVLMGGCKIFAGKNTIKGVAGYDLASLFVGSEGTLGVFTDFKVRLLKKPPQITTLLVTFTDEFSAAKAVINIVKSGLVPVVLEFLDSEITEILRSKGAYSIPADAGALLLCELDGKTEEEILKDASRLADICERENSIEVLVAESRVKREKLWTARRELSETVKSRAAIKISEDITVPRIQITKLLNGLKSISKKHKVLIASYGHAGDGNFHVNILYNDVNFNLEPCLVDIFSLAINLGGTITGEHGIGLAKKKYLPMEKTAREIALMKSIKHSFDPKGLLNPGKIFN